MTNTPATTASEDEVRVYLHAGRRFDPQSGVMQIALQEAPMGESPRPERYWDWNAKTMKKLVPGHLYRISGDHARGSLRIGAAELDSAHPEQTVREKAWSHDRTASAQHDAYKRREKLAKEDGSLLNLTLEELRHEYGRIVPSAQRLAFLFMVADTIRDGRR